MERQLASTPGIIRYSVRADILVKRFWTLSVWQGHDAIRQFSPAEPHASAVKQFPLWAAPGAKNVRWASDSADLDWSESLRRLETTSPLP